MKIRVPQGRRAVECRVCLAWVSTRLPNEFVGIRWLDHADPKRPGYEVLVASERLDIGFAAGWARLGVREVQGEVAADDWKVVHGDPVNHQNVF